MNAYDRKTEAVAPVGLRTFLKQSEGPSAILAESSYQRRLMCKAILFLLLAFASLDSVFASDQLKTVNREEFRLLWVHAAERMPPPTPLTTEASLLIQKHDQVWVDHEYVVDAQGDPSDYKFYGIEPPEVDPRPFQALVMTFRYRPVDGVAPTPVRYRGREHFYWPRPAQPGEED